jgi:hypothetical protein
LYEASGGREAWRFLFLMMDAPYYCGRALDKKSDAALGCITAFGS